MTHSLVFDSPDFMDSALESVYDAATANGQQIDFRIPEHLLSLPQYCQPYLDHSYAACLSLSSNSVETSQVTAVTEPLETLTAYIDIEDVSCNTTVVTAPMDREQSDDSNEADPWEGSVTRCICDFQHDDGYMICCDRCGVWQHVDCMGVDRNNIPDSYLCELCLPRPIDKRRAIRLQTIKKEQMDSEMSATDSSSDERRASRGGRRKKREMPRKYPDGRSDVTPNRPVKRRSSEAGEEKQNGKRKGQTADKPTGSRGARRQSTGESSARAKRNSAFDNQHHVTIDHSVEDVCRNSYTNGVLVLLASVKESESTTAGKMTAATTINPSLLKEQISKQRFHVAQVGPDARGIAASEMIRSNQAVAEYTGRVMMSEEYELDNHLDVYVPFVLRYAGPQGFNVCIDSTISGNDARYVRCSCTPNSKVVHITEQSTIRFFICATKNISEGREVTIPFYFDYQKCNSEVTCACSRASCQVARFFKQKSSSRPMRVRRSATQAVPEERSRVSVPTEMLDNGKGAATPSSVRQHNRRSAVGADSRKNQLMSPDVGADITLMNALTAISSTTTALSTAPSSSSRSMVCSTDSQSNGGHSGLTVCDDDRTGSVPSTGKSGQAPTKEAAAKGERRRKTPTANSRNNMQELGETGLETVVNRLATARSNRLRDKALQMAANAIQKD